MARSIARRPPANPPRIKFVHVSGKAISTLAPADYPFWEYLNQVVQEEPSRSGDLPANRLQRTVQTRRRARPNVVLILPDDRRGDPRNWGIAYRYRNKEGSRDMRKLGLKGTLTALAVAIALPSAAQDAASDQAAELAKKLANPIASMISLPIQYNYDQNFNEDDEGSKELINIQPVIPFSLNEDWNLITRTIVPLVALDDMGPIHMDESGLGDVVQSFFFSPKAPVGGWIIGAGPVFLYPTATDDVLGGEKWGAGPTGVFLRQDGPWTYGLLANQIWSFAGNGQRDDINATFIQPFAAYIYNKTKTTVTLTSESTYDWKNEASSVPINLVVAQMLKIGPQIMQLAAGPRYWVTAPDGGPEGWGLRLQLTLLWPK
jgi:hypothetical protein